MTWNLVFSNRQWQLEVQAATKDLQKPSLAKAIIRCYRKSYAVLGFFTLLEVSGIVST